MICNHSKVSLSGWDKEYGWTQGLKWLPEEKIKSKGGKYKTAWKFWKAGIEVIGLSVIAVLYLL